MVLGTRRDRDWFAPARSVAAGVFAAIGAFALVGCGADSQPVRVEASTTGAGTTAAGATVSAGAAARAVCATLRSFTNTMVDHANAAAAAVASTSDAATRARALGDGFARLLAELDPLATEFSTIALPAGRDWDALRADLLAAPDAARSELSEERAALRAVGPIRDEDEQGRVGQFFNALEKVFSLVEPTIRSDADPAMRAAFHAEPDCRFVVSVSPAPVVNALAS